MNRTYLVRVYYRHIQSGWPFVREYIFTRRTEGKPLIHPDPCEDYTVVQHTCQDITGLTTKDWISPYSLKALRQAGIKEAK